MYVCITDISVINDKCKIYMKQITVCKFVSARGFKSCF